jgi:TolB-like protein/class 3 adenylate cyclase
MVPTSGGKQTASESHSTGRPISRLTTIVFADAAGASTAMSRDEIGTLRLLEQAMELFFNQTLRCGGRVLNHTGDGAFAGFESVAGALTFSLGFQEGIAKIGTGIAFRLGVHLGDIFEETGRVYGDCINIAARVQSITPVGAVYVSDLVYRSVRGRSEFVFEYIGSKRLKNIPEPLDVYRVYGRDVAATLKASPRPLPPPLPEQNLEGDGFERPSIAVLPFRNLSGDREEDYFAEGIADDIITSLGRFRGVDVIAQGSSFVFRDKAVPIGEIGKQLRTRYVADGSVRRLGHHIRVAIELFETQTGRLIWAERYDRNLEDIFEVQDEIATLAVAAMSVTIESAEQERTRIKPPNSLDAYSLVLKGTSHLLRYSASDIELAHMHFRQASFASPGYARSYAGMSRAENLNWRYHWGDDPEGGLRRAFELAARAVEIDPNDARGYAELGFALLYQKEHDRSLASYRRALALNPNEANILAEFADALAHSGEPEEALRHFDRAMRLNPFYPDRYLWCKAGALTKLRRFDHAVECIQGMNNPAQGRRVLACCYAYLGRIDEARNEAELIREAQPGFSAEHWAREIVPDRRSEDIELFVAGLKAAGL